MTSTIRRFFSNEPTEETVKAQQKKNALLSVIDYELAKLNKCLHRLKESPDPLYDVLANIEAIRAKKNGNGNGHG